VTIVKLRHGRRHPGQALAWYGILLGLVLLPLFGIAIDTGLMFTAHRKLQMLTDGAARVGAMQIDAAAAYETERVVLAPAQAEAAAEDYLSDIPGVEATASASPDRIEVHAQRSVALPFEQLFGRAPILIQASAAAVPCSGVEQADGAC
jgi:uncharacterized membrane protein